MSQKAFHYIILIVVLLCNSYTGFAQKDVELVRLGDEMYTYGSKRDALDVFLKAIKTNDKNVRAHFMAGKCYLETNQIKFALDFLQKAYKMNPKIDEDVLFLLGKSYQGNYKFDDALENYSKFKKKLIADKEHKETNVDVLKMVDRKISECTIAKEIVKDTVKLYFNHTHDYINSTSSDYAPVISNDEKTLYFTSRRQGSTGGKKDNDNNYFEDIYVSHKVDGKWSNPENMGAPINSEYHEGCIGISKDGKELYIYKEINAGDIYVSKLKEGNKWSKPEPLSPMVNTDFYEPSVALADSGKTLYFSSNKPGGQGGLDLYMSKKDDKGNWQEAVNLGPEVNTASDEDGPFYDQNTKYLYFSSAGHKGMGGYDVFRAKQDSITHKWSKPYNLGYPINSPDDDIYYTLTADGKRAFYSSFNADGTGDKDIFEMDFPVEELKKKDSLTVKRKINKFEDIKRKQEEEFKRKQEEDLKLVELKKKALEDLHHREAEKKRQDALLKNKQLAAANELSKHEQDEIKKRSEEQHKHEQDKKHKQDQAKKDFVKKDQFKKDSIVIIKGKIVDKKTGKALQATVEVYDGKGKTILKTKASGDGSYSFNLPAHLLPEYSISVEIDGYMYNANDIKYSKTDNKNVLQTDVVMSKLDTGFKTVLKNVYYDINSASLHESSYLELDKLAKMMKSNPNLKAQINGHTDNMGPEHYNLELSQRRVEVIVDYLEGKGIAKSRILGKGFGSSKPIASNDDEYEGRELNRRTEFEVLK
jgi:outer membrane protein OmpA-like peptidoglycan-associated protein